MKKTLLSQSTKTGILIAFLYTLWVFISFIAKSKALESLMITNYIPMRFGEQADKVNAFVNYLIFGEIWWYAFCGLIFIGGLLLITQINDVKKGDFSIKSFLTSLWLFFVASLYLLFILWGNWFIYWI